MKKLALLLSLLSTPALAASPDQYWQQLMGAREAQSAEQLVQLAQQLDQANAKLAALQKVLDEEFQKHPEDKEAAPKRPKPEAPAAP